MPGGWPMTVGRPRKLAGAGIAALFQRSIHGRESVSSAAQRIARPIESESRPVEREASDVSDRCQICGPNPQECPTVLCAPCALVQNAKEDRAEPIDGYDTWSIKRLAWAFGCAAKNSDQEGDLYRALKSKILRLG